MGQLDGTRTLITGATTGLGRAMAEALVAAGSRVAINSRDPVRAADTAAALGTAAIGVGFDVGDEAAVADGVEQVYTEFGGIDLLVNNAGIGMRTVNPRFLTDPQPFYEVSPEGFRGVLETNLTGYFLVARTVVPRMLAAGAGRVVNISMNSATMVRRGFVPYGPSRAGAESLSRIMAADLAGTGVTVNVLLPGGATRTGMVPAETPEELNQQLIDPAVMGPPIVWLASPDAEGVTDERIVAVDFDEWLSHRPR